MHGNILLEHSLALSWMIIDPVTPPSTVSNQLIFTFLDNLDEPMYHKSDKEHVGELMRIETKLNLIMQLLGQLLQSREVPQPVSAIRFTSDTLAWQVEQPPPVGSLLQVSLYPEDTIPLALTFEAKVLGSEDHWLEVDMHGLSEDEQAMWSRWVFRQHRRHVARARTMHEVRDK